MNAAFPQQDTDVPGWPQLPGSRRWRWSACVRILALGLATPLAAGSPARAQDSASVALEARLPELSGLERARALSKLTDGYRSGDPARAIGYGNEALELFERYPDPEGRVSTLNEMAWAYMTLGQYDSSTSHVRQAQELAERVGFRRGLARSYSNRGALAQRRGDPALAVENFERALAIQREIGDVMQAANSLNNLGFVHSSDFADYGRALEEHLEALHVYDSVGNEAMRALSLNNIGIVYSRLRQYERAREHFLRALDLRREIGAWASAAGTLSNLGDLDLDVGNLKEALAYHREALAIREEIGDPQAVAFSHRSVGLTLLAMGQADSAREALLRARQEIGQDGDRGESTRILLAMAAVNRSMGISRAAIANARDALTQARVMGSRELMRQGWEELSAGQAAAGEYEDALRSYMAFKALSDSIFDAATSRRVASIEGRYAQERRGREAERLRSEAAMFELAASRRTAQRNAVAAVAVVIGLIGVAAYRRRLDRARMAEELSMTDTLTSARNRRYVRQLLPLDMATSLRRHRAAAAQGVEPSEADIALFVLDMDHFKQVNDQYGHAAGDRLLADLAAVLRGVCRDSDVVARWGGEEFLIVGRFMDRGQAPQMAERLRAAVEAHVTTLQNGHAVRVTCSIGYSVFPFSTVQPERQGWEELVGLADHASYAAKRQGRNRWIGFVAGGGAIPEEMLHASPAEVERWLADGRLRRETELEAEGLETAGPVKLVG